MKHHLDLYTRYHLSPLRYTAATSLLIRRLAAQPLVRNESTPYIFTYPEAFIFHLFQSKYLWFLRRLSFWFLLPQAVLDLSLQTWRIFRALPTNHPFMSTPNSFTGFWSGALRDNSSKKG